MASARKKSTDKTKALNDDTVDRALTLFRGVLREHGHRQSTVRDAVARAAMSYDGHFEVNDLLRVLRDAGIEDAHMATVYRTLPLLVDAGLIQPALLSAGDRQFYERVFERPHHDHLICVACGKVVEFEFEAFEVLQQDVAKRYGFELTSHVHELKGRCPECRRAGPSRKNPTRRLSRTSKRARSISTSVERRASRSQRALTITRTHRIIDFGDRGRRAGTMNASSVTLSSQILWVGFANCAPSALGLRCVTVASARSA